MVIYSPDAVLLTELFLWTGQLKPGDRIHGYTVNKVFYDLITWSSSDDTHNGHSFHETFQKYGD